MMMGMEYYYSRIKFYLNLHQSPLLKEFDQLCLSSDAKTIFFGLNNNFEKGNLPDEVGKLIYDMYGELR